MNIDFKGKRILVTGAGNGIGKALAIRLSKFKGEVIALSKTKENLDNLKKEDPKIITICVDLGDWEATRKAVQSVLPVDLLVNNAAIVKFESFLEVTPNNFDAQFNVNLKSVLNVSQVVAKDWIARKIAGSIVHVSSQTSIKPLKDHCVYSLTKAALDMLTRTMTLELGPYNIRVNSVNPTVVLTDMGRMGWSDPKKAKSMLDKIPLGRFAEVDEVLDVIVFLLSNHSSMVNGSHLLVDGGFVAT